MRAVLPVGFAIAVLGGCSPTVWEKTGPGRADFQSDARYCRAAAETMPAADACMRARGWSKTDKPGNPASTIAGFVGAPDPAAVAPNFLLRPADTNGMRAPAAPEPISMPKVPVYTPPPAARLHCIGQVPIPNLAIGPECP